MPQKPTGQKAKRKTESRKLKPAKGRLFGIAGKKKYQLPVSSSWQLFKASNRHLWENKKIYGGISAVYIFLSILLIRKFSFTTDLGLAKESFDELLSGAGNAYTSSAAVFSYIVGANSPSSEAAALYQSIITILVTLATVWALRQTHAKKKISLKDTFYKSTYPLVQFLFVLIVVSLQCLPFVLGSFLFNSTVSTDVASGFIQKALWSILAFALIVWSLYMVSASIFALFIVTLPEMAPLQALRSAKKLLKGRRWTMLRKVIFMPIILVVIVAAIMFPVIMFITPLSEVIFILLFGSLVVVATSYIYTLYRELL